MNKTVYIKTVGCQMNVLDSEMVIADLKRHGYRVVQTPDEADLLLYNTCSIREQAEEKTYSALGKLRETKAQHPDKKIGVLGCMAQKDQEVIFRRAPFVDMIVGPGQLHTLPQLISNLEAGEGRQMAVSLSRKDGKQSLVARSHETFDPLRDPAMRPTPFQAYLRIQIGCDKFCTYCVVPNTRGPEQGRSPAEIVAEARTLADQGCLEITLLGQTVNSYRHRGDNADTDLAGLLEQLHEIDGIRRLKFVTNYPKDMNERLLTTVRDLPKCSPYLHVPAQSGSDAVLKRMKRGYTVSEYMEMFERIERILPQAAVSSDFIVGFYIAAMSCSTLFASAGLRPERFVPSRIVSGGQTGVDRGALDAAITLGITHGGWCPAGRLAEDGTIPARYQLAEMATPYYPDRTEKNVLDSDATLILYRGRVSGGTRLTQRICRESNKPVLCLSIADEEAAVENILYWLAQVRPAVLNIAGPRESNAEGIAEQTRALLLRIWFVETPR